MKITVTVMMMKCPNARNVYAMSDTVYVEFLFCFDSDLHIIFYIYLALIHPNGPLIKIWHIFVLVLLIYTCIEVPMTIAFEIELNIGEPFGTTAFMIDLLLLIDVLINFRTAYFDQWDKLRIIISDTAIMKNYCCGWFFFDFITVSSIFFIVTYIYTFVNGVQIVIICSVSRSK